jgi:putative chitinase
MRDLTPDLLQAALPRCNHVPTLYGDMMQFNTAFALNTPKRISAFLAQIGHESADCMIAEENLNYSAARLLQIFPSHFSNLTEARTYEFSPVRIANRVYANRMGNGDESSGDGWTYHGRGYIQSTGKTNYNILAGLFLPPRSLADTVAYLKSQLGALHSAYLYWNMNHLNIICDAGNIPLLTRRINGGLNGIDDRMARYTRNLALLGGA